MARPLLARSGLAPTQPRDTPHADTMPSRPLTTGEIALAEPLFGSAIKYGQVRIIKGSFLPFSDGNAMTPFGKIYFPPDEYKDDFSTASDSGKVWLIHELAHVWQYHLGFCVACQGVMLGLKGGYGAAAKAYDYDEQEDKDKRLSDFNMEQQGELISHYFDAKYLTKSASERHRQRVAMLPFYEAVLKDFLKNPHDASLLPNNSRVGR